MATARLSIRTLLTERCNLACVFCHNEGQPSTTVQMSMPPEVLLRAVRAGAAVAPWVTVKLSGGEPTLHPQFLEYLSAAVAAGANEVAVISNAHRLLPLLGALERCPRLRFSVNVPSCDQAVYRQLTGAPLDIAVRNIRALVATGGSVSLNAYWPGNRTPSELTAMVDFSRHLGTTLKLLAPCQIANRGAERHSSRYREQLLALGFAYSGTRRHVDFYKREGFEVRVQRPWCPSQCRSSWGSEATFRIRATGDLTTCLAVGAWSFGNLTELTEVEIRAVLTDALSRGASMCQAEPAASRKMLARRIPVDY